MWSIFSHNRLYKPLIWEVKKWPQLNLDCGPDECPFDIPQKQRRGLSQPANLAFIYHDVCYLESGVKAKAEKSDKKRPGYCECCNMRFDDFALVSCITLIQSICILPFPQPACQG